MLRKGAGFAVLLILGVVVAAAGEASPAGTWKITLPTRQGPQVFWLFRLEQADGQWTGNIVATAEGLPKTTLEGLKVGKDLIHFRLKVGGNRVPFELRPAEGDVMLGNARLGGRVQPLKFERTRLTKVDPDELEKEKLAKAPVEPETVKLALDLLGKAQAKKAKLTEARSWAEKAVKVADAFGPAFRRDVLVDIASTLTKQEGYAAVALPYARQAERMLDPATDRPGVQKHVLEVLVAALKKAGKDEEAKEAEARLEKIDISVKPTPYAGRKADSDRAVLVELFTGAQCPPCVGADLAFDALEKGFKPSEVIALEYHLHIPGPDPMTNPDTEARAKFYERSVQGTPTILFNGKANEGGGGDIDSAADLYAGYADAIKPLLEKPAKAAIKLKATANGDKIDIQADVSDLKESGDDVRLRLVLVEHEVHYKGGNGLPTHHHVVRSFPGGTEGLALKKKTGTLSASVDLGELRKKLNAYLDKFAEKEGPFPNKERPLELKNLSVVAFVQNDESIEVLQAVRKPVAKE